MCTADSDHGSGGEWGGAAAPSGRHTAGAGQQDQGGADAGCMMLCMALPAGVHAGSRHLFSMQPAGLVQG